MKVHSRLWWLTAASLVVAGSWVGCSEPDKRGNRKDVVFDVGGDIGLDATHDASHCNGRSANACGGCEPLSEVIGAPCGPCDLDQVVCESDNAASCSGETSCDAPGVRTLDVSELSSFSVVLHGELINLGNEAPTSHGFCVSSTSALPAHSGDSACNDFGPLAALASFSQSLNDLSSSTRYVVRAYATNATATTYGVAVAFLTLPESPTDVVASVNSSDLSVSWSGVTGATGYQIKIGDSETWIDVEDAATHYIDASAPMPSISSVTIAASKGTLADAVSLTQITGGEAVPATSVSYRVRALNDSGASEPSEPASGRRSVGKANFKWQRSAADADVAEGYSDLEGATTLAFLDASAPPSGEGRYYRLRVSAEGALSIYSAADRGYRLVQAPVVETLSASNISQSTAVLHGRFNDRGTPSATLQGFCWSTAQAPTKSNAPGGACAEEPTNTHDTFSHGATGLVPGTTYYARAFATNGSATVYGSDVTLVTIPASPANVSATDGTHNDRVVVSWNVVNAATGYEIRFTDTSFDGAETGWSYLTATSYSDTGAPSATLSAGSATASSGTSTTHVILAHSGALSINGATRTYQVRSVGPSGKSSPSFDKGYRGSGTLSRQWLYSDNATAAIGTFSTLANATSADHLDTTAPANGSVRRYAMRVSAVGATSVTTAIVSGQRGVLPALTLSAVSAITESTANMSGTISNVGAPSASAYGVCWSTTAMPTLSSDCRSFGEATSPTSFTHLATNLTSSTTYFVRAYATNSHGTVYSNQVSFLTVPRAPTNLVATQGTSIAQVGLSWTASAGATQYVIYRGSVLVQSVTTTSFNDSGATPTALTATGFALQASTGLTDHVSLSWTPPTVVAPPTHTYTVHAINAAGQSVAATATGYRGLAQITGYELDISGSWIAVANTTYSHVAPEALLHPGVITAGVPLSGFHVRLTFTQATTHTAQSVPYRVRAVNAHGPGPASSIVNGHRTMGLPVPLWHRSIDGVDFDDLALTTFNATDTTAEPLVVYTYRALVSAPGVTADYTNTDTGHRRDPFSCDGICGLQAASGCWCDTVCLEEEDCCADACDACGQCPTDPPDPD
ncbi:MAG: hypothetical protein H0U74_19670 [Bradymonadaceae bacterium]|nr:hypothetical protein [Lujinxingiaceae bacterium]